MSRKDLDNIIAFLNSDKSKFKELMKIFFSGNEIQKQKAAWVLGEIAVLYPQLSLPYFDRFISIMNKPGLHPSIYRAITRIWMSVKIPVSYCAEIFDLAMCKIKDESESIAVRAFLVKAATNICVEYPELKNEFLALIFDVNHYTKIPALKATIRYAFKKLKI